MFNGPDLANKHATVGQFEFDRDALAETPHEFCCTWALSDRDGFRNIKTIEKIRHNGPPLGAYSIV